MINEVYNIDNMEYMKTIEDNYFELAIVDPPYGINIAEWDDSIPEESFFNELFRISKNQIIWGGNYFNLPHTESWLCWDKTFKFNRKMDMSAFELAWTSFNHKSKFIRYTCCGNFRGWKNPSADYKKPKQIHPCEKDIEIYKWLLKNYAKPGDKILDTHEGSGSHRIACYELGFDHYGCENDIDHWNDQELRFNEFKKKFHNEFYIPKNEMSLFN